MCTQVRRMSGEEFWEDHVRLQKRKDHFLWTIESTGDTITIGNAAYDLQ